ncbi:MAG TPA: hypothetical protein VJV23_11345 [Candidatus Polarisedimenticolia bacterium]|nr:hypothetical protein [Candidatus Polarisedimenticolia bacterium]
MMTLLAPWLALIAAAFAPGAAPPSPALPEPYARAADAARRALRDRHGDAEAARIERGTAQAARFWRQDDGDPEALRRFLEEEFLPRGPGLDATFHRLEFAMERIGGYMNSLQRDLRRGVDLEIGPMLPVDERLGSFAVDAHLSDDLFANKIAFVVLLNFPLTTLQERLEQGPSWTRRQWAEARLAQRFSDRVPAEIRRKAAEAFAAADTYISGYNIYMHHLLDGRGERLFPPGLRLISHWNLRDELKARYADPQGLPRQRMIQQVMERIVRQEIPAAVIGNPLLDWNPGTNTVSVSAVKDVDPPEGKTAAAEAAREPDERYRRWLEIFHAVKAADPWFPDNPTFVERRFNVDREIPEEQVKALFEAVLTSPHGPRVAGMIASRLGRPLEPFDIWYAGFKPRGKHSEADLDARTRQRYPNAQAYAADIPRLLGDLGFSPEKARFLADHIEVEPSRGAGHALGAARRDDKAHLRTRIEPGGMDYKGYNIAVHEMGHNVEQVFSVTTIDHTLLQGVPNTAFTEALAFVFQGRDMQLLGLAGEDGEAEAMRALEEFWATREIAGVALVDMAAWRWLYENPGAEPAAFRQAVVRIASDLWNRHYAPLLGGKDVTLLAIYSHMIDGAMYTPDYPLGHLIAFQIDHHFRKTGSLGEEFERVSKLGTLTPELWMRQAVGAPLSAEPLLEATARALETFR